MRDPISVRPVTQADRAFWSSLDGHLSPGGFDRKVRDRMGYVLFLSESPAGILRFSLFWDEIPFCDLIRIRENARGKGCGRALMAHWEKDMVARGFDLALTSTQADEEAQYFYRALGYRDCGAFTLPFPGHEQPTEIILGKHIA